MSTAPIAQGPVDVNVSRCQCSMRTKLVGDGCEVCNPELAADFEPYCRQCGSEDLAYVEQYADSKEYKCRECGSRVTANVELRRGANEPDQSAAVEPSPRTQG